jgi:chemotaxis protein MotB
MKGLTHVLVACMLLMLASCVTQKKYVILQTQMSKATEDLRAANEQRDLCTSRLNNCQSDLSVANNKLASKDEQLSLLKDQLNDCKTTRDKQLTQVGDLTVLSKGANDNISQTLAQLQDKDRYIQLLQAAKTKADSINLALAINLKGVLKDGLDDKDVDIKVDKTVVYINLSDKMLYDKGSYNINPKAKDVLGKIAAIVSSRPEVDVMVEGYTDNTPISTSCLEDNWDLSVKRATSVVRVLQKDYNIDPNKLIAAGRGEYNTLVPNDNPDDMATNRRTRIIILPKLNQFYDLLDPTKAAK